VHYSIKASKAPGFSKPAIFHKVMQILEAHHFRLPACRFVLDLFDKRVLQQIVMEEEEEEDEDEDEEEKEKDAQDDEDDDDSDDSSESESESEVEAVGANGLMSSS
jgi:rapamycin-insensitive companion of mTOR